MSESSSVTPASGRVVPPHVVAGPPPRSRLPQRRTLLILAAISMGWKVLVFTLGAALPNWLLTDGIAELPASHRAYGTASLVTARALFDTPIERLGGLVRQLRVMSVDSVHSVARPDGTARLADGSPTAASGGEPCVLGAHVRAYTYFAIPYSDVRTRCDRGVIEYHVFRPRTRVE